MAAGETLTIDPVAEDSTNAPFELSDPDSGVYLMDLSTPTPQRDIQWVGTADTEGQSVGSTKYQNREINIKVRVREPQVGAAATNLATNPSGELAAKAVAGTDYAITREAGTVSIPAQSGYYRDKHAFDGSETVDTIATFPVTFPTGGVAYVVSLYVWVPSNWTGGAPVLDATSFTSSTGEVSTSASLSLRDQWQRIYTTLTPDAGDLSGNFLLERGASAPSSAGTGIIYSDSFQIETGTSPSAYFDGDQPGCSWSGTAHSSTSTRPASGGPLRDAIISELEQKVGKVNREGGTLKRIVPGSHYEITFDLLDAEADPMFGNAYIRALRSEVEIKLIAKPFARGAAQQLSDHSETTLPYLVFTETGIKGDVPALGKLVIDEDQGADQQFLMYGVESRYYSSSADAALYYTAEGRTALSTSATAVGPTGAVGAGSNVMRNSNLFPSWSGVMSTQASGGNHLAHVGSFRVWARIYRRSNNSGAVSVRLSWSEGDFRRFQTNPSVDFDVDEREDVWTLVDLGLVTLSKAAQGTQQWQGRVEAKSTVVNDRVDIDHLFVVPVEEGYGEVRGVMGYETPSSLSARDEFDQSAGALAGKTAAVGGNWAGAGDTDDFAVETTGATAQRTAVSDADTVTGRYGVSGLAALAGQAVQVDFKTSALGAGSLVDRLYGGVLARYVDTSNWAGAFFAPNSSFGTDTINGVSVRKRVAGTTTTVASVRFPAFSINAFFTIRFQVLATGLWSVWAFPQFGTPNLLASGTDTDMATGGTLASGKPGIYDVRVGAGAATRNFDNFAVFVPTLDAAVFASQSIEIRHDRVIREDSAGSIWAQPTKVEGNYLTIPPAGREGRTARIFVKGSRFDPDSGADPSTDDISARLTVTPRYLEVPAA